MHRAVYHAAAATGILAGAQKALIIAPMKYFLVGLLLLLAAPGASLAKYRMRVIRHIVLDPGHGGTNPGAPSVTGVFEKYLTLPLALEVERQLREASDATVTLTRRTDTTIGLRERARLANEAGGDVFISIHCNASENPEASGLEVYFLDPEAAESEFAGVVDREERGAEPAVAPRPAGPPAAEHAPLTVDQVVLDATMFKSHEESETLAGTLLDTIHDVVSVPRRGVHQAAFGVLKEAEMPAVVLEVGYLSHAEEGKKLAEPKYQEKLARGIVKALLALDKRLAKGD